MTVVSATAIFQNFVGIELIIELVSAEWATVNEPRIFLNSVKFSKLWKTRYL